jgi:hypothetical protein
LEPLPEHCPGFAEAAAYLAMEEEQEGGLYRRFRYLSTRNLLYMQTELDLLEDKLRLMDEADKRSIESGDVPKRVSTLRCAMDWSYLAEDEPSDELRKTRMKLIRDLRRLTKEYSMFT